MHIKTSKDHRVARQSYKHLVPLGLQRTKSIKLYTDPTSWARHKLFSWDNQLLAKGQVFGGTPLVQ
jgi:hypothetical protein